jgi:hypothetical protein
VEEIRGWELKFKAAEKVGGEEGSKIVFYICHGDLDAVRK